MLQTNSPGGHVSKEKTLEVEKSQTMGKLKFRPQNDLANKFCSLLKQKSLTLQNLEDIKGLGYTVVTKAEKL